MKLRTIRWRMRNGGCEKRDARLALRSSKSEAGCAMRDAGSVVQDPVPRIPHPARRVSAFTLIELLVVIGILGLLIAILLPALSTLFKKSDRTTAKLDLSRIVMAWENYYREYGKWPVGQAQMLFAPYGSAGMQNAAESGPGMRMLVGVMTNLMYPNAEVEAGGGLAMMNGHPACIYYNPKRIHFMEYHPKSINAQGHMVDPWTNVYYFMFDMNKDGRVVRGGSVATTVYSKVIAWSLGPDGALSADDVKSWE